MENSVPNITDEKLSILSDHYHKSLDTLKNDIKNRDIYFLTTLSILTLLLIKIADHNIFEIVINRITQLEDENIYRHEFSNLFLWGISFFFYVRYTQFHSNIEVSYKYFKELESELSHHYSKNIFTRESRFYKDTKSYIKKTNMFIFKYIFPLLMLAIIIQNIYSIVTGTISISSLLELTLCSLFGHHIIFFMKEV